MEAVVLFDNIVVYKNAFNKSDELLSLYHDPGFIGMSEKSDWVISGVKLRNILEHGSNEVLDRLYNSIQECKQDFIYKAIGDVDEDRLETINIREYSEGTSLTWHADFLPEDETFWSVTINVYLNDDYEGGKILFKMHTPPDHAETEVFLEYKPEKGDILIFPSGYPYYHRTTSVTRGIRYYVNTMIIEKTAPTWQYLYNPDKLTFI